MVAYSSCEVIDRRALRLLLGNFESLPIPPYYKETWWSPGLGKWIDPLASLWTLLEESTPCHLLRMEDSSFHVVRNSGEFASLHCGRHSHDLLPGFSGELVELGCFDVSYNQCNRYWHGRKFAANTSLQSIARPFRHTFAHKLYHDIDMVNAFPSILAQYCSKKGIPAPELQRYAELDSVDLISSSNRELMLSQLVAANPDKLNRSEAKKLIVSSIHGGFAQAESLSVDQSTEWFGQFVNDIKLIHDTILADPAHKELIASVSKRKSQKGRSSNVVGSVISSILTTIEDDILMAMIDALKTRGVNTGNIVLVFDGLMILKQPLKRGDTSAEAFPRELMNFMSQHALETTGYYAFLTEKAMDEAIDLSGVKHSDVIAPDIRWVPSLNDVLSRHSSAAGCSPPLVLSKRVMSKSYERVYASFEVTRSAGHQQTWPFEFLARSKGKIGLSEVLSEHLAPLHMFFRLSTMGCTSSDEEVLDQFLAVSTEFFKSYTGTAFSYSLGDNSQICVVKYANHTKFRIVLDALSPNLSYLSRLAGLLNQYILSLRLQFPALVNLNTNGIWESVLDMSVYAMRTDLCIVTMADIFEQYTLDPVLTSSINACDHLIGFYNHDSDANSYMLLHAQWCVDNVQACARIMLQKSYSEEGDNVSEPPRLRMVGSTIMRPYTSTEIDTSERFMNLWPAIVRVFTKHIKIVAIGSLNGVASVSLAADTVCPYAGVVHSDIYGDGVCLLVDDVNMSAKVVCHHPECLAKLKSGGYCVIKQSPIVSTEVEDRSYQDTLHTQRSLIHWDEVHDSPDAIQIPYDKPIVCLVAQMGSGKSEAVVEYLTHNRPPSVLSIAHSITLARKNCMELQKSGLDFQLYQDIKGFIDAPFLSICLDSLTRVMGVEFDVLVIDEILSLLAHFNSPLMKDSSGVSYKLQILMLRAKHVLLIDAAGDCTPVKLVVDWLEERRGVRPYCILNTHVRSSTRTAKLFVSNKKSCKLTESSLSLGSHRKTLECVCNGENVVHVSNIKSNIVALEDALRSKGLLQGEGDSAFYYSDSKKKLVDPSTEWLVKCLAFSPTISSGISFTAHHFQNLTAYFDNAPYAPGADIMLQMLYRVRNIASTMHIFFQNSAFKIDVPHSIQDVVDHLSQRSFLVQKFLDRICVEFRAIVRYCNDGDGFFDRSVLSWPILVGFVASKNRSLVKGLDILQRSLIEDYGVPVEIEEIKPDAMAEYLDLATATEISKIDHKIPFEDLPLIDSSLKIDQFLEDFSRSSDLDPVMRALAKLYKYASLWEVRFDLIDEDFYCDFILKNGGCDDMWRLKRWLSSVSKTSIMVRSEYDRFVSDLKARPDANIAIFRDTMSWMRRLVVAIELLELTLSSENRMVLNGYGEVKIHDSNIIPHVDVYHERPGSLSRGALLKMFHDHMPKTWSSWKFYSKVLSSVLGVEIRRGSLNANRREYHIVYISVGGNFTLLEKYRPFGYVSTTRR